MKRKLSTAAALLLSVSLILSAAAYTGYLYLPERKDYGALWNQYLQEPEHSVDLLVLGSSFAYCSVVPAEIYQDSGVAAYVMAAPEATASLVYYYLREALQTQSPGAVMVEATSFFFHEYENYTKVDVGYMPWGINRLEATFRAAEPSERLGLLFPLYNYHSLWTTHSPRTYLTGRTDRVVDPLAGYTFLDTARPQPDQLQVRNVSATEQELANNFSYLEKIIRLCEDRGIQLCFFYAPTRRSVPEEMTERLRLAVGPKQFKDFTPEMDAMGLDPETDFFDTSHLNCNGAEKFSRYLSGWLKTDLRLSPSAQADRALWEERTAYWKNRLENSALRSGAA